MLKCLIVDDEEQNLYLLDTLLRGHGYETLTAENGEAALILARQTPPDLIISDIMMPVMDGFQFCRACKTDPILKNIPFVFYTAQYTENQDEEFAMSLGADRFIVKPQEPEIFVQMMKDVLMRYPSGEARPEAPLDRVAFLSAHDERVVNKLEEKMAEMARMNRALYESEQKYRLLAENVHDVLFVLDEDLRYKYVSPSVRFLRGYEPEEIVGVSASESMTASSWLSASKIFAEEMERDKTGDRDARRSRTFELEMLCKGGDTVWVEVRVSLLRNDQNEPAGVLGVTRDISERKKAEEELARSYAQLRSALVETVQAMASLVAKRDPYTAAHQRRVTDLSVRLAAEMDLSREQLDGIYLAAMIHDIGKISIPAEILTMSRKLRDLEFRLMQTHAQSGHDILKDISFPWPIARMIREHHERMDGSGYPFGLTGEGLLLESRILAVADVVEAMVSHRPYRPSLGLEAALEEISQNRGILYDSEVVDACMRLFQEKNYRMVD